MPVERTDRGDCTGGSGLPGTPRTASSLSEDDLRTTWSRKYLRMHREEFGTMNDPVLAARENRDRAEALVSLAQRMVVVFAILLIGCGGLRTLG